MKIIIVIKEDIKLFPPVISIIKALRELGHEVVVIGHYTDMVSREELQNKGVRFMSPGFYDVNSSLLSKLKGNLIFRHNVRRILVSMALGGEDYLLWIFQGKTIALLHRLVDCHPCVLHPLEFVDKDIKFFYRILSPRYNASNTYRKARKVVSCEYNRAHILKGILGLENLPFILPNKMIVDEKGLDNPPDDIRDQVASVKEKLGNRKVILYQGIYIPGERRLEDFCKAMGLLGDGYVLVIMGGNTADEYEELRINFPDANILFVPFIPPPYHLLVTSLAHIGILTYFPRSSSLASVINPLYCAPNKIFEYSRFGIPMIGNDIPGLHYIFREFGCGVSVNYPMGSSKIREAIEKIFTDYDAYSRGARSYFDSVDIYATIKDILR